MRGTACAISAPAAARSARISLSREQAWALGTAKAAATASKRSPLRRPPARLVIRVGVATAGLLLVLLALPEPLSVYYTDAMTQVAVYSMAGTRPARVPVRPAPFR